MTFDPIDTLEMQTLAADYRATSGKRDGVVLIWQGEVYGWKDELRDARHERPGVVAVDAEDSVFRAEGGDDDNGAKHWVVINPSPAPSEPAARESVAEIDDTLVQFVKEAQAKPDNLPKQQDHDEVWPRFV